MATLAAFIVQFPEFANTTSALVQAHLDAAALEVPSRIWGTKTDQGIYYLTAHKLASSPFGNDARLAAVGTRGDATTIYLPEFRRLQRQVSSGFRVT